MHLILKPADVIMPSVVGTNIQDAFALLSSLQLHPRLLAHKEDRDLPAGTVLRQIPEAAQRIKVNQSVYLLLSSRPLDILAPCAIGNKEDTITSLEEHGIRLKKYVLPNFAPQGTCFAQFPSANEPIDSSSFIIYISGGMKKLILWPRFEHRLVTEAVAFLKQHGIAAELIHTQEQENTHDCSQCYILQQNPRAGSFLVLDHTKPIKVQFLVKQ